MVRLVCRHKGDADGGILCEAIELAREFLVVAGDGECEIRQIYEGPARRSSQFRFDIHRLLLRTTPSSQEIGQRG